MPVLKRRAELRQGGGEDGLAVLHLQVAVRAVAAFPLADAPRAKQVDEVRGPVVLREGHRDLVGDAVAVGVAFLDGLADLVELLGGGGHLKAQLVQPRLVDELDALGLVVRVGEVADGQGVDVAVHLRDHVQQLRIRREHLREVGSVLLGQVLVQRHEQGRVVDDLILVQGGEERVGQIAGGQHDVHLVDNRGVIHGIPVDLHAGGLLSVHGTGLRGNSVALVQRMLTGDDGDLVAGSHRGHRKRAEHQAHSQKQGQEFFHGSTSFTYFNASALGTGFSP